MDRNGIRVRILVVSYYGLQTITGSLCDSTWSCLSTQKMFVHFSGCLLYFCKLCSWYCLENTPGTSCFSCLIISAWSPSVGINKACWSGSHQRKDKNQGKLPKSLPILYSARIYNPFCLFCQSLLLHNIHSLGIWHSATIQAIPRHLDTARTSATSLSKCQLVATASMKISFYLILCLHIFLFLLIS